MSPRTVKDPEERRRELLEAAMSLFMERGYDSVSMRDIAREAGVTAGLAYHYFDSKQNLFAAAIELYADECSAGYIRILDDPAATLAEKIGRMYADASDESGRRYHRFFHAEGNAAFHEQFSLAMCRRVHPHLVAAIGTDARRRGVEVRMPETLASFILYGQLGILSSEDMPDPEKLATAREYVEVLLASQTVPAATP